MNDTRTNFLSHVTSRRFLLTLVGLLVLDRLLEHTTVAQRATLGGFDTANLHTKTFDAGKTAVIAISAQEAAKYFKGKRPVPPDALASVVTRLLRLNPSVLVVDVFTDGPGYSNALFADSAFGANQDALVWARALDPSTAEALPILSGLNSPPGRSGLAVILADDDHLVRRFRPMYDATGQGSANGIASLPLAAARAFVERPHGDARVPQSIPSDTASIGLREYDRNPPLYLLDDVLTAAASGTTVDALTNRVLVLGFIDGSDQVLTARGVRAGPAVVADAVETLLDDRPPIRRLPDWADWLSKVALSLLVGFVHFRLPRQMAAIAMIVLTVFVVYGGLLVFNYTGFWINYVLIVVGFWIEQLYGDATHADRHATAG